MLNWKRKLRRILSRAGLDLVRTEGLRLNCYQAEDFATKPYINIGAGTFFHPCWTNIDFHTPWYAKDQSHFINHDLTQLQALPLPDHGAKAIYTSHTIEHIPEPAVRKLFEEAYRCLVPGGIFRITTPDADLSYDALYRDDEDWFAWDRLYDRTGTFEEITYRPQSSPPIEERWLHLVASQLAPNDRSPSAHKFTAAQIRVILETMKKEDALDHFTSLCEYQADRPGNHVSWWNYAKMKRSLEASGFATIRCSGYQQSMSPQMRLSTLFDGTFPQMSLYVEAVR